MNTANTASTTPVISRPKMSADAWEGFYKQICPYIYAEYFEMRSEMCDICAREGYGTRAALKAYGWELFRGGVICPNHD